MFENQNRGTLHIHKLIWTAVLPSLLQKVSHIKEACNAISDPLSIKFKYVLDPYEHLEHMVLKHLQTRNFIISNDRSINPPTMCYLTLHENACKLCTYATKKQNIYSYHFTCYKGLKGLCGCRMDSS